MSLRWRILSAFILVIVFTILLSVGVEYWSAERRLGRFSAEIRANDLAQLLSRLQTRTKSWDRLERELVQEGVLIDPARIREAEEIRIDLSDRMAMRVIVRDVEGIIIADTFASLEQAANVPQVVGDPVDIVDLDTQQVVGTVAININ